MEPEFLTYQRFNDIALANELAGQLDEHGIKYYLEEGPQVFNPSFALNNALKEYEVKIKAADFEKVNQLLRDDESKNTNNVDKDYYLFAFSNEELIDVITKADEWNAFDVVLARKILAERGKPFDDKAITAIKEKRIEDLKKPEPSQSGWIVVGYVFAVLGGFLGFFIGWYLFTYKKTLPDGERVYGYIESDRRQGKIIFYLSFIGLIVAIILKINKV
jgi:hypothetical protein